jgi:hypothetical protein
VRAGRSASRGEGAVLPRLASFVSLTLTGDFAGDPGDPCRAHRDDPEFGAFVAPKCARRGRLRFGRARYDRMADHWPTPAAGERIGAGGADEREKFVASRPMARAEWHTRR